MEVNYSGEGNPDKFIGWTLHEDMQDPERPKSYTCSFCKRGFSNAQALGGHMNIHRRDRAKLKQASEELSLDSRGDLKDLDEGNTTPKRADHSLSSIDIGDGADDNTKRLIGEDVVHKEISGVHLSLGMKVGDASSASGIKEKNMEVSKHFAKSEVVDLELRLGPEPHETSRRSPSDKLL